MSAMFWNKDKKQAEPGAAKAADLGRNDPCHCGSGKKYKKCCMAKDEAAEHAAFEKQYAEASKAAAAAAEAKEKEAKAAPSKDISSTQTKQKPTSQVTEHHRNTIAAPKFNMPRRTGGG